METIMIKNKRKNKVVIYIIIVGIAIAVYYGYQLKKKSGINAQAEIDIPAKVWNLLEKMDELVAKRKHGGPNKLMFDRSMIKDIERTPTMWKKVMLAQAYDAAAMKKKSLSCYIEAARMYPSNCEPWVGIGQRCLDAAIFDMCMREKTEMSEKGFPVFNPDDKNIDILQLAREYLRNAKTFGVDKKSLSDGTPAYLFAPDKTNQLLRDVESMIMRYWLLKGKVAREAGQYEESLELFDKGLLIQPNNCALIAAKGVSFTELCRYEESFECFQQVVKERPRCTFALNNYGISRLAVNGFPSPIKGNRSAVDFLNRDLQNKSHKIRMSSYTVLSVLALEDSYAKTVIEVAKKENPELIREFETLEFDTSRIPPKR